MISSEEIQARARRLWSSGDPLRAWLGATELFPYLLPFRRPSAHDWLERFAELRAEVERLEAASKARLGVGYAVAFREVAHQKLGHLRVPDRIVFESAEDVAACAGESPKLRRFTQVARILRSREPGLTDWLAERPLRALECDGSLPQLLAVIEHFKAHPRPMRFARELGIPGVDSKFIEENRALLGEWLDRVLPTEAVDATVCGLADNGFERRFGLRFEESLIRFRWLDRSVMLAGRIADATVPLSEFIAYAPQCERVVVTENKINFLTLPECSCSLAVFGGGYAIERLEGVAWLGDRTVYYWGDIDTHGFAILSRLRGHWAHVHSLLMDRETLLGHKDLWSQEPQDQRCLHDLHGLHAEERALYDDLRGDRFGERVRLEQERIDYGLVQDAVAHICGQELRPRASRFTYEEARSHSAPARQTSSSSIKINSPLSAADVAVGETCAEWPATTPEAIMAPFAASEFYSYYQLKPCSLRVYLRARGVTPSEPDAYHKLLVKLGQRHEHQHLEGLGEHVNANGSVEATRDAVAAEARVIYQAALRVTHPKYGEVVGVPDFLIRDGIEYLIRDCKLSRRFSEDVHPEIFHQLELYGWLYEETFGRPPVRLEAYMGDAQLRTVAYQPDRALAALLFIQEVKGLAEEPYDPIGWSKCLDGGFSEFCWGRARERRDVAQLPGVDQALARALRVERIATYDELLARHTEVTLAEVKKDVGGKPRRVGNAAPKILQHAKAYVSGETIRLGAVILKRVPSLVMFDVEGIPPHLEYSEKTYLWGVKLRGERPEPYRPAIADVGEQGDLPGWERFLENCRTILAERGDIPFVHWSPYERTQIRKYVEKYGDRDGIAARILTCLYDLQPVVEASLVLPTPSYGLKLIERFAGYTRQLPEAGGKWSMATYIEAVETEDPSRAASLIGEIARYNEEDLDALWAVYTWLRSMS